MEWSKTTIFAVCAVVLIGLLGYQTMSLRSTMEERMGLLERDFHSKYDDAEERVTMLSSDLDVINKRMGVTTQELQEARTLAKQLKQENTQMSQRLRREIATKADTKSLIAYHEDSTNKLNAVQEEATTKINGITGDVRGVRT